MSSPRPGAGCRFRAGYGGNRPGNGGGWPGHTGGQRGQRLAARAASVSPPIDQLSVAISCTVTHTLSGLLPVAFTYASVSSRTSSAFCSAV